MLTRLNIAALVAFPFLCQLPLLFLYFANDGKPAKDLIWWAHYTSAGALIIVIPIFMTLVIMIGLVKIVFWLIFIVTGLDYFNWLSVE